MHKNDNDKMPVGGKEQIRAATGANPIRMHEDENECRDTFFAHSHKSSRAADNKWNDIRKLSGLMLHELSLTIINACMNFLGLRERQRNTNLIYITFGNYCHEQYNPVSLPNLEAYW